MAVPMAAGNRVEITSSGCNIDVRDENAWFDLSCPCGMYKLNLSCPYDRAISFALLRLVASHQRISVTGEICMFYTLSLMLTLICNFNYLIIYHICNIPFDFISISS